MANSDLEYSIIDPLKIIVRGGYVFDHTNYKLWQADDKYRMQQLTPARQS